LSSYSLQPRVEFALVGFRNRQCGLLLGNAVPEILNEADPLLEG
jgi:hypothetical protein